MRTASTTRTGTRGLVAIAAISALGLAACSGGGGGPQTGGASKLTNDKIVIGLLNDQSGVYKDLSGPNSAVAIQMAIDDYKAKHGDQAVAKTVEIVQADHQNKADVANSKAQEMYDRQNADLILDVPNSAAALAVATQAKAKKKLYINIGAGTTALTGAQCNKYTFHWAYDTAVLAKGTAGTIVGEGGKTWNIVYPDYAFGQDMNKSFSAEVKTAGGTVGQSIATPVPQRQLRDVHHQGRRRQPAGGRHDARRRGPHQLRQAVQPERAQGQVRAGRRPDVHHRHPLARRRPVRRHPVHRRVVLELRRAEQGLGRQVHGQDPDPAVVRPRRELLRRAELPGGRPGRRHRRRRHHREVVEGKKINDFFLRNGEVRAADHNVTHDVYLAKVKTKDQVKEAWDYEEITKTVPAAEAYGRRRTAPASSS